MSQHIGRNDPCTCGSGKKFKNCCLHTAEPANLAQQSASRPNPGELLKQALAHHEAGRLQQAQELYAQILRHHPNEPDALHYSGLAAHQSGQTQLALELMARAVQKEPRRAHYHLNLGQVLDSAGSLDRAIASYRQAIALDGSSETAHLRLAQSLMRQGRHGDAAAGFSQALRIHPQSPEAACGLGNALRELSQLEQSVICYRQAIAQKPDYVEALNNLGTVLHRLDRFEEAIACYRQALVYRPDSAEALNNLGTSLRSRGELDEAVECCRKAVALEPAFADGWLNLANAYKDQGLLREAVATYRRAMEAAPEFATPYTNLGDTLLEQDRLDEAVGNYQKAIALGSESNTAYSNLLGMYSLTCHITAEEEREVARNWEKALLPDAARAAARQRASARSGAFPARPRDGRKLRLGIVSAELGAHVVAVFLLPFLDNLDRSRIRLTLFPTVPRSGPRADHIRSLADGYISLVGVADEEAAGRIRAEEIDVLIDTTGHTSNCRLGIFAHRAAPVQCSYIGYWSTTGLTEMDWYITDNNYSAGCETHFTEGLWRLPHVAHCYQGDESLPIHPWSPDPDGTIWLGSLNKYSKIRSATLALWARVLRTLPEAKLLLEDRAPHDEETHERILTTLQSHAVNGDRVIFLPPPPGRNYAQHMALYDRFDIALDTIPFNSGTTALDALWMGVPLVALEGDRVCGRMASSIVTAVGHPEWSARTEEEYVSLVCVLARDVEGRRQLRRTLRASMLSSELCDGKGLARTLEDAFDAMYDRWLTAE